MPSKIAVWNESSQSNVCNDAMLADTAMTRLFGLLGKRALDEQAGLLIRPSSGVHTWAMSMAIDVLALDKNNVVIGAYESVKPWRICGLSLRTKSVLELPAGRISRCQVSVGDRLQIQSLSK